MPPGGAAALVAFVPACVGLARCTTVRAAASLSTGFSVVWKLLAYHWADREALQLLGRHPSFWISLRITTCLIVFTGTLTAWHLSRRGWLFCGLLPMLCSVVESGLHWIASECFGTTTDPIRIGLSQMDRSPLGQAASCGGVALVSWLVAAINGLAADAVLPRSHLKRQKALALAVMSLITLAAVFGALRLSNDRMGETPVAMIPARFPADVSGQTAWQNRLCRADLVVFPESALPCRFGVEQACDAVVTEWADRLGRPLVVGGFRTSIAPIGDHIAAAIACPGRLDLQFSDKQYLVPAVETSTPFLRSFGIRPPAEWQAGRLQCQVATGSCRFVIRICHDALFARWIDTTSSESVDFVVHLSNVTSVVTETSKWRLRQCVQLRAIESGLPVVHCAMGGPTCLIDGAGQVVVEQNYEHRGELLCGDIPRKEATRWSISTLQLTALLVSGFMAAGAWCSARAERG